MLDRIKFYLLVACILGGLFILTGSAGASDLNQISVERFIVQGLLGLFLMLVGVVGLNKGGYDEDIRG